MLCWAICLFYP